MTFLWQPGQLYVIRQFLVVEAGGGSTFMAAQRVSTAASVSSFSSSQECLISSGYHAAHAVLTGLAFCSMIVIFKAQISLFLVSSLSCKGFYCLCISLEIRSANSCRLG